MVLSQPRRRQPLLFETAGPWPSRFGADFFRAIPAQPGVYFFHDAADRLLYIGQSGCLRDRIGSYRHVDPQRNARRTLRLIQKCVRIEWVICPGAAEAVAMEAALLLENRPPFNRAGVWPAADCWMGLTVEDGRLELSCTRTRPEDGTGDGVWFGPLPGRFRWAFAPLARLLFQVMNPSAEFWDFPAGLLSDRPASVQGWKLTETSGAVLAKLERFLISGCPELLDDFRRSVTSVETKGPGSEFWSEQWELIVKFSQALQQRLLPA